MIELDRGETINRRESVRESLRILEWMYLGELGTLEQSQGSGYCNRVLDQ